jgi:hypothetical protein
MKVSGEYVLDQLARLITTLNAIATVLLLWFIVTQGWQLLQFIARSIS